MPRVTSPVKVDEELVELEVVSEEEVVEGEVDEDASS
jgi:hypothetical protein